MSAPDTDITKEERRHKPALMGIKGALAVVILMFVGWVGWTFVAADGPDGAATQVDGRTGEVAD
ncbi:hypothetical protein [Mesobacterium pallidum]|uniref:hypothetical protein n=1 Tax=Mesobacterium pallidum TaxID=2872037 RepID=UPI001EE31D8F|nr:hypothetical protein [Mesobacterium pallidum]